MTENGDTNYVGFCSDSHIVILAVNTDKLTKEVVIITVMHFITT